MENNYHQMTVAQIVRADYRTADVFKRHGINYCCGGTVPFPEACLLKGLAAAKIEEELGLVTRNVTLPNYLQFNSWKIDFLIDYIINVHHAYARLTLPSLGASLTSFALGHKKQYPYLESVVSVFEKLTILISVSDKHEEDILFPYIKQIETAHRRRESYGSLFVKTLRKPLGGIQDENTKIGDLLLELRSITNQYSYPENACTNHRVVFQKLEELDNDLFQHKHLENNILFPRAIEMETELLQL